MKKHIAILFLSIALLNWSIIEAAKSKREYNAHVNGASQRVGVPKANMHAAVEAHQALLHGDEKTIETLTNGIPDEDTRRSVRLATRKALARAGNPVAHVEVVHTISQSFNGGFFDQWLSRNPDNESFGEVVAS